MFVGRKDEMCFDSHPWLETDYEDCYNINGGKYTLMLQLENFVFLIAKYDIVC